MYQVLSAAMILALCANNIGVMWAAIEAATLTTVVMVSIYRTRESLEAAWKYFILCSVGIALALFGTILVYLAGQTAIGPGAEPLAWSELPARPPPFAPTLPTLPLLFLLLASPPTLGPSPLHTRRPP